MRFTIRNVMLAVAIVAVLLVLPAEGWVFAIPCLSMFVAWWLGSRGYRRIAALGFGGLGVLSNVLYVVLCTYPHYMLMPALSVGWMVIILPMIGSLGAAWAYLSSRADAIPRRPPFVAWLSVIALALMPALTLLTLWPLHVAFLIIRPSLEGLADRAVAGKSISPPRWVGPYLLVGSNADPTTKVVGLFTDANPSGRQGFVRFPPGTPSEYHFGPLIGSDLNVNLGWGWKYQQDD